MRSAALGALAGVLLGVVETATRWVPASLAAGLHPHPGPPLAAASALAALGALARCIPRSASPP